MQLGRARLKNSMNVQVILGCELRMIGWLAFVGWWELWQPFKGILPHEAMPFTRYWEVLRETKILVQYGEYRRKWTWKASHLYPFIIYQCGCTPKPLSFGFSFAMWAHCNFSEIRHTFADPLEALHSLRPLAYFGLPSQWCKECTYIYIHCTFFFTVPSDP